MFELKHYWPAQLLLNAHFYFFACVREGRVLLLNLQTFISRKCSDDRSTLESAGGPAPALTTRRGLKDEKLQEDGVRQIMRTGAT